MSKIFEFKKSINQNTKMVLFFFSKISNIITKSNKYLRKTILIFIDFLIILFALNLFLWINPESILKDNYHIIYIIPLTLFIYLITGQYKGLIRYQGSKSLYQLAIRNFIALVIFKIIFPDSLLSTQNYFLLWIVNTNLIGLTKFLIRDYLLFYKKILNFNINKKVIIYGAGEAGAQLAASLILKDNYQILCFIDDNSELWNRSIRGIPINSFEHISKKISKVDKILIAIPSISKAKLKEIINAVSEFNIPTFKIPKIDEISSGKEEITKLKPISIEDILGREPVKPLEHLLGPGIKNEVIAITGAGGSIGSELCLQILHLKPRKLVIFEISEPALYEINQKLNFTNHGIEIIPILGDVSNFKLVKEVLIEHNVSLIFHAAAYKHVFISEINLISALKNNIFSTNSIARASIESNVKKTILISSDKAVRPTNIMGASKRIAEQIFQAYTNIEKNKNNKNKTTSFSMVRFGNVLGSSGSVVPLFEKQINEGGPVTLTDPDVERYFMTIYEAAQLVIQTSVLSKGGEVFLLDMGKPVRLKDLAEKMIKLKGLPPSQNIEIKIIGLKPGEKLFEELIIDSPCYETEHKLIFKAAENCLESKKFFETLNLLENMIIQNKEKESLELVHKLVPEWEISDFLRKSKTN